MYQSKRLLAASLAIIVLFTSLAILPTKKAEAATEDSLRLAGSDRYSTAIEISKDGWQQAENVILATGENFPDALCAAPLAKQLDAPILLTESFSLSDKLQAELSRLKVKNVYIVGGTGVISHGIQSTLDQKGVNVVRLSGVDRYKTSLVVAEYMNSNFIIGKEIVVATGENFPDALSIAPVAAKKGMPIILSSKDMLPDAVKAYVTAKGISKAYVIGGTGVVSDDVKNHLPGADRIWGSDRYATNIAIMNKFKTELDFNKTYVATGEDFPDALAGSALAPKTGSPIVLTDKTISGTTRDFIGSELSVKSSIKVLGGEGVIPPVTLKNIVSSYVNTEGNSQNNLNNFGITSIQGSWVYYADFSDNQNLYKSKLDGSSKTKLTTDGGVSHINVLGEYIYYSGMDGKLYRIMIDGTDNKVLVDEHVHYIYVTTDWIYYYTTSLNKIKHDGSSKTKVMDMSNIGQIYFSGNYIYFTEQNTLYKANLDGSGKNSISYQVTKKFTISGDWIYYMTGYMTLYKFNINGGNHILVTNDVIKDMNIVDGWIYYINSSDANKLYKILGDGSNRTKAGDISLIGDLNIAGNSIFSIKLNSLQYNINRMKTDGTGNTKIGSDIVSRLKFSKDFIYYVDIANDGVISKMKPDGSDKTSLVDGYTNKRIDISGDYIYYINIDDKNTIYKIKADGSENFQVLDKSANDLAISGDYIYFSNSEDNDRLYKVKTDGTSMAKLSDNESIDISVHNGWVYYYKKGSPDMVNSSGLYKIKIDGSSETPVIQTRSGDAQSSGNNIYYISIDMAGETRLNYTGGLGGWSVAKDVLSYAVDGQNVYIVKKDSPNAIIKLDNYGVNNPNQTELKIPEPAAYVTVNSGWVYYGSVDAKRETFKLSLN